MKVWIIQDTNNDFSAAEEFGEVEFITRFDLSAIPASRNNSCIASDIRKFLSSYIPMVDYILPSGNPMLCATIAMSLPSGEHNFLKWDGRRSLYIPYKLRGVE